MPSSYQVVLWKQESFVVLRPLQSEFFRILLGSRQRRFETGTDSGARRVPLLDKEVTGAIVVGIGVEIWLG
jgi:hypothetical protein